MPKKSIISLIFFFFILLHNTMALDYTDVNVTATKGIVYHGQIEISYTNSSPHTYPIYDVNINDIAGFHFTKIPEMRLGNKSLLNFTYISNSTTDQTIAGLLTYNYYTKSVKEPKEVLITIDESGISNTNQTIYINDTIKWQNVGNNTHTITDLTNLNDFHTLLSNQTYSRTFTQIGKFNYYDEEDNYVGKINIKSNKVNTPTHTPNFDSIIFFKLLITEEQVIMTAQIVPSSFEMKHNKERKGIIILSGNDTVYGVHFASEWMTFSKNDFEYKGNDELIEFTINPSGIDTNAETGKTYQKIINITGSNIKLIQKTVSITIEPFNFTIESGKAKPILVYEQMTPEMMIEYCKDKYGDLAENWKDTCAEIRVNITQKVIEERILHPDITETEAKASIDASKQAKEGVDRLSNQFGSIETNQANVQTNVDELKNEMEILKQEILGKLDPIGEDVKEKKKDSGTFTAIIITFIIIGGITLGIVKLVKKIKDARDYEMEF